MEQSDLNLVFSLAFRLLQSFLNEEKRKFLQQEFKTELGLTLSVMGKVLVASELGSGNQKKLKPDMQEALKKLIDSLLQYVSSNDTLTEIGNKVELAGLLMPLHCRQNNFWGA